jgi:hypothetical protein
MKMPLFCFRTVKVHRRTRTAELSNRHAPLQICTPRKLIDSFPFLATDFVSSAPAIGAEVNVAMEETPQDMPIRVPRSERSGHILGKQDPGSVTSPAEKKPADDIAMSMWFQPKRRLLTPECTKGQERLFSVYADPAQRQNARGERTCYPCQHDASIVSHISAAESPKERRRNRNDKYV